MTDMWDSIILSFLTPASLAALLVVFHRQYPPRGFTTRRAYHTWEKEFATWKASLWRRMLLRDLSSPFPTLALGMASFFSSLLLATGDDDDLAEVCYAMASLVRKNLFTAFGLADKFTRSVLPPYVEDLVAIDMATFGPSADTEEAREHYRLQTRRPIPKNNPGTSGVPNVSLPAATLAIPGSGYTLESFYRRMVTPMSSQPDEGDRRQEELRDYLVDYSSWHEDLGHYGGRKNRYWTEFKGDDRARAPYFEQRPGLLDQVKRLERPVPAAPPPPQPASLIGKVVHVVEAPVSRRAPLDLTPIKTDLDWWGSWLKFDRKQHMWNRCRSALRSESRPFWLVDPDAPTSPIAEIIYLTSLTKNGFSQRVILTAIDLELYFHCLDKSVAPFDNYLQLLVQGTSLSIGQDNPSSLRWTALRFCLQREYDPVLGRRLVDLLRTPAGRGELMEVGRVKGRLTVFL